MRFLKPTSAKVILAIILTVWPYIVSFFYVNKLGEGDIFSDSMVRSSFWQHAWAWSPLYYIVRFFSEPLLITLGQSGIFVFLLYPFLRLFFRYLAACIIVFFVAKLFRKRHIASQI